MKETFTWIPWFSELAEKIAEGGQESLNTRATRIEWGPEAPFSRDDPIEPLGLGALLARHSKGTHRRDTFLSASHAFELRNHHLAETSDAWDLPDNWHLTAHLKPQEQDLSRAWTIFRQAVSGSVDRNAFSEALKINGIALKSLSTMLFLVNPSSFLPLVDYPTYLRILGLTSIPPRMLWEQYSAAIKQVQAAFPGCDYWEIELFERLQRSENLGGQNMVVRPDRCWSITTNANWRTSVSDDRWTEFRDNSWVRTDNAEAYPVNQAKPGDLVLARFGRQQGRGIGMVYRNDYGEDRLSEGRIHTLWLNTHTCELGKLPQEGAFSEAGPRTVSLFRERPEYATTWHVLDGITYDREIRAALHQDRRELGEVWRRLEAGEKIADIRATKGNAHTTRQIHRLLLEDRVPEALSIRKAASHSVARFAREHEDDFSKTTEAKLADLVAKCSEGRPSPPDKSEQTPKNRPSPRLVDHNRNRILYGPPGTGKTYATVGHAMAIVDGAQITQVTDTDKDKYRRLVCEGRIAMVTFHQNYAYEDFVEGIRPRLTEPDGKPSAPEGAAESSSSQLEYERRPGIFRRICEAAEIERQRAEDEARAPECFVLIIDEINRGNIPKIFGELITLIEDSRRLGEDDKTTVTLPYSGHDFGIPNNLYIVGTMNTADRSIQQLDTALRRRFTFVEMMPNPRHKRIPEMVEGVNCREMLRAMNERIAVLMDREHQIGHTYLFKVRDLDDLSDRFRNKIFPLLQEYFYDDWKKIRAVLGDNDFVKRREIGEGYAKDLARKFDLVDEETVIYERLPAGDSKWTDASQYRMIYDAQSTSPDTAATVTD